MSNMILVMASPLDFGDPSSQGLNQIVPTVNALIIQMREAHLDIKLRIERLWDNLVKEAANKERWAVLADAQKVT